MGYYKQLLAWDYRSRIARPTQPGCKQLCNKEKRVELNQLWKIRKPNEFILYCRKCGYYTSMGTKFCYCCKRPMAFALVKNSKSRHTTNENKTRY